eukprot:gene33312-44594_t
MVFLSFCLFFVIVVLSQLSIESRIISIRGHAVPQSLPASMTAGWKVWTFDSVSRSLEAVESESDEGDWLNPTSFDELYLPRDLPVPLARPALGVLLHCGVPRYVMPSVILTLETPTQVWRNRGLNSLPRAAAWIDLFAPYTPRMSSLRLSCFGQSTGNLRFLEDQDGSAAWESLLRPGGQAQQGQGEDEVEVSEAFEDFRRFLASIPANEVLDGYHFVDVPVFVPGSEAERMRVPRLRLKAFLSDFDDPARLLEMEAGPG